MLLADGARLAAVDVMTELWSGAPPENLAPTAQQLIIEGPAQVDPGDEVQISTTVADPEGGAVRVRWVLRPESGDYVTGGDFRPTLPDIEGAIIEGRADGARVLMPEEPGAYRVFLYVYDEAGKAATANIPLLVKGEPRTRLPLAVYEDHFENMPWAPSGWMGSVDSLTLDGHVANTAARKSALASDCWKRTGRTPIPASGKLKVSN